MSALVLVSASGILCGLAYAGWRLYAWGREKERADREFLLARRLAKLKKAQDEIRKKHITVRDAIPASWADVGVPEDGNKLK